MTREEAADLQHAVEATVRRLIRESGSLMMGITAKQVTETELHTFSVEASTLGWPPGHWPARVETDLGNGQALTLIRLDDTGAHYDQPFGCIRVTVWND
jgi:hypothetical protein